MTPMSFDPVILYPLGTDLRALPVKKTKVVYHNQYGINLVFRIL